MLNSPFLKTQQSMFTYCLTKDYLVKLFKLLIQHVVFCTVDFAIVKQLVFIWITKQPWNPHTALASFNFTGWNEPVYNRFKFRLFDKKERFLTCIASLVLICWLVMYFVHSHERYISYTRENSFQIQNSLEDEEYKDVDSGISMKM